MIQVGAYPTRSDAELAQTALTAAEIPSMIAADDAGGAYPFDLTGGARLLVDEGDAEDAASILAGRRVVLEARP
jgi:Putative prokaryotic signal transducing protein